MFTEGRALFAGLQNENCTHVTAIHLYTRTDSEQMRYTRCIPKHMLLKMSCKHSMPIQYFFTVTASVCWYCVDFWFCLLNGTPSDETVDQRWIGKPQRIIRHLRRSQSRVFCCCWCVPSVWQKSIKSAKGFYQHRNNTVACMRTKEKKSK